MFSNFTFQLKPKKMKKLYLALVLFCFIGVTSINAAAGFWDSFAILNVNGGGNSYFDLSASTDNTDYQGHFIGTMSANAHSLVLGGQIKTWKNNGTDVTGVSIFYRIFPDNTSPSGGFTEIPYAFQLDNLGGTFGDQQWGSDVSGSNVADIGVDILAGSNLTVGTYVLDIYVKITTNGVNADPALYDSRYSQNYQATFEVSEVLPIEINYFTARSTSGQVLLNWTTASEFNIDYFEIQSSSDSHTWSTIGNVQRNLTTREDQGYSFVDGQPVKGINYYRLKQVNFDGSYLFSGIISVMFENTSNSGIFLFPNPVREGTNKLQLSSDFEKGYLLLYNSNGKILQNWKFSVPETSIDISELPSGTYYLQVNGGGKRFIEKVIIL
jgi:hypothetical protein